MALEDDLVQKFQHGLVFEITVVAGEGIQGAKVHMKIVILAVAETAVLVALKSRGPGEGLLEFYFKGFFIQESMKSMTTKPVMPTVWARMGLFAGTWSWTAGPGSNSTA